MRDRDVRREAEQAAARAILRAELRALVDAHPHLRGRVDLAEQVLRAAGIDTDGVPDDVDPVVRELVDAARSDA